MKTVQLSNPVSIKNLKMIHGIVDWSAEELIQDECLDLGIHKSNRYFIQPIDDNILLLGERTG